MPVQLLPFQKLVDMPNMAQRYRRAICGLAIASIVLIILILSLLVCAFIASFATYALWTQVLFVFAGIPLVVMVVILVCTSSYISLRNTDKWASTDVCCNLTRSHPTCCTKRCASNKHCCARMSCLHIAASVWTSLFCVLLVTLIVTGCTNVYDYSPGETCRILTWFQAPMLVLMICLAITTAVSACLLRAIEKEMPQIEPLPAGKMVVLACPDTVEVPPAPTTEVVRATEVALAPPTEADRVAMGEGNSTTDVKTEQNV